MVNNSSGVIYPVSKSVNLYVPRSTMGSVYPLKYPLYPPMAWLDHFLFNPNYINRYLPNIISYIPLAESSTWHFHVTIFFTLSSGKVNSIVTFELIVILPVFLFRSITASFLGQFFFCLPNLIVELHPLYNIIQKN